MWTSFDWINLGLEMNGHKFESIQSAGLSGYWGSGCSSFLSRLTWATGQWGLEMCLISGQQTFCQVQCAQRRCSSAASQHVNGPGSSWADLEPFRPEVFLATLIRELIISRVHRNFEPRTLLASKIHEGKAIGGPPQGWRGQRWVLSLRQPQKKLMMC